MRPLLALTEDGELHPIADVRDSLAEQFDLSEDDLTERIPSGRVTTLQNRVGWFGDDCWRHGLSVVGAVPARRLWERRAKALGPTASQIAKQVLSGALSWASEKTEPRYRDTP